MRDDEPYDEEREDYASLADEMNDDGMVWVESNWDPIAVKNARKYAKEHDLSWPPRMGDYDRFWEREQNARIREI